MGTLLLLLVVAEALCRQPGTVDIGWESLQPFVRLNMVGACVYFLAVAAVRGRHVARHGLTVVLVLAAAMRVMPLLGPPMLSTDIYRYVWDGRVQAAGINPYRFMPADPALRPLRDAVIYPHINRSDTARTIYPPAAQIVFAATGWLWSSVLAMKLAMVAFEALAIAAVVILLRRAGLPPARVLIYAWNPLTVWEFAGNGHIDAMAIGLIALAWLAASTLHRRWAGAVTGAVLGLAILCKFLPAAICPAFWRRWDWRMVAAAAVVIAAFYSVYLGVGWGVLGYLPGYANEEGLATGSGFFLLRVWAAMHTLPPGAERVYLVVCVAVLAGLAGWIAFGRALPTEPGSRAVAIGRGACLLAFATTIALSPHYPWYLAWLALFACLGRGWSAVYLPATGALLYLDPYHQIIAYPFVVYGGCLVLAGIDVAATIMARRAVSGAS